MGTSAFESSLRAGRILALLVCACSSTHRGHPNLPNNAGTGSFDAFATPGDASGYATNYANVIAETGSEVKLDGVAIDTAEFAAIGASGFSVARIRLASSTDAVLHRIESADPVGVQLYGYAFHTAYSLPGGIQF